MQGNELKLNYHLLCAYFFFYFFTWSSSMSMFQLWLRQDIQLSGANQGLIFSFNAVAALIMQPLYGFISDRIGLKKRLIFIISLILVMVGPFFIFVYGPLLRYNLFLGAIVGAGFLGAAFHAGVGAVETYIEKMGRKCDFEYGKARMWGSLGWASATFFAGKIFTINPNINFLIASLSAMSLVLIVIILKGVNDAAKGATAEPIRLKDVFGLLKMKEYWFFAMFIFGVVSFYSVYDQQFPGYFSSLFEDVNKGNAMFGYLNSFQVFLEAGMMFLAPSIVNRMGVKRSLLFAGFVMVIRIIGSGVAWEPIGISCMKLLHALELPILLIAIFKYFAQHFDERLSSTMYLVGFQFSGAVAAIILSPIIGALYDAMGFRKVYLLIGCIALVFNLIAMFTLSKDVKAIKE